MPNAASITKPFVPVGQHGYSCQTVLARKVNEYIHNGTYYCWFSVEFNPGSGGNSSNPLWLYQTLSHAVRSSDVNDAKVQQIRMALMDAVSRNAPLGGSPEAAAAIVNIRHAAIELFRPQIWRINLEDIKQRMSSGHQYPAERKVEDLKWQEFVIIVE